MQGEFLARAVSWVITEKNGKKRVELKFKLEGSNTFVTYFGYFVGGGTKITLEALEACGWNGRTLKDLSGCGKNMVRLMIEEETWTDDVGEVKTADKVKWVNPVALADVVSSDALDELDALILGRKSEPRPDEPEPYSDPFAEA